MFFGSKENREQRAREERERKEREIKQFFANSKGKYVSKCFYSHVHLTKVDAREETELYELIAFYANVGNVNINNISVPVYNKGRVEIVVMFETKGE